MQATSELYRTLARTPGHVKEVIVRIAGRDYVMETDIVSLSTSGGAFPEADVGNCMSRQIDLVLRKPGEIPWNAEMRVFARLRVEDQVSEWLPKGVFFIASRKSGTLSETLKIHGFDAMLKAGDVWDIDPYANWPMPQREAVEDIARQMGIEVDPRTSVISDFPVGYPVDEDGDLTMTDILEGIAVCNAGNWVISDEGKLLLLRYGDIPKETNYLVTEHGRAIVIGGKRILVG